MARDWSRLLLSEMTWWERTQAAFSFIIALAVCIAGVFGVLLLLGQIIDVQTERRADHDRCLKRATNGYEIRECR